jgi:signal transduction histidine kinase/DNA-binding NarL/FixJ family response regulator
MDRRMNDPQGIFPGKDPFSVGIQWEMLGFTSAIFVFCLLLGELFPNEISRNIFRTFPGGNILSIPYFIMPVWMETFLTRLGQILYALVIVLLLFSFGKTVADRRENSLFFLTGTITLIIAIIVSRLCDNPFLMIQLPFGFVVIILAQSFDPYRKLTAALVTEKHSPRDAQARVEVTAPPTRDQNRELLDREREKTDFFIRAAHETKTPITLIANLLEGYIEKYGINGDLRLIQQAVSGFKRDMVNLLDLEKLNRGQDFYHHDQSLDLSDLMKTKVHLFREIAKKKQIALKSDIARETHIKADPFAMDRVINNLVDNAIRYTEPGGHVTVALKDGEHGSVSVEISDTGVGIPLQEQKSLFTPYRQLSRNKRNIQGMGIGLNIVKKIVDQLEGVIGIRSEPGKGTTFSIRLKKHIPSTNLKPAESPTCSKPIGGWEEVSLQKETFNEEKPTLLVVENNLPMLHHLQTVLCGPFNFFHASNGREALEKLKSMPLPQVILSDLMMEEMDGHELLGHLSQNESLNAIPVVIMTANTAREEMLNGLSRGAVDFILKPFSTRELSCKLLSIIKKAEAQKKSHFKQMSDKLLGALKSPDAGYGNYINPERVRKQWKLTPREVEVIDLLVSGVPYKEISARLFISLNTLKPYVSSIYRKCDVRSKIELQNALRRI